MFFTKFTLLGVFTVSLWIIMAGTAMNFFRVESVDDEFSTFLKLIGRGLIGRLCLKSPGLLLYLFGCIESKIFIWIVPVMPLMPKSNVFFILERPSQFGEYGALLHSALL
jgi:hypothetical protein